MGGGGSRGGGLMQRAWVAGVSAQGPGSRHACTWRWGREGGARRDRGLTGVGRTHVCVGTAVCRAERMVQAGGRRLKGVIRPVCEPQGAGRGGAMGPREGAPCLGECHSVGGRRAVRGVGVGRHRPGFFWTGLTQGFRV